MGWASLLLNAKGRVGRADFWIAWLLLAIAAVVLRMLGPIAALASILLAYPQVCLFSKRLHDVGKSGWWTAAVSSPVVLALVVAVVSDGGAAGSGSNAGGMTELGLAVVSAIWSIGAVAFFLGVALRRGQAGVNAYGPPAPPVLSGFGPRAA